LGVAVCRSMSFVSRLRFGRKPNKKPVAYTHILYPRVLGSGRTVGSKVNNLQKLSDIVLADVPV